MYISHLRVTLDGLVLLALMDFLDHWLVLLLTMDVCCNTLQLIYVGTTWTTWRKRAYSKCYDIISTVYIHISFCTSKKGDSGKQGAPGPRVSLCVSNQVNITDTNNFHNNREIPVLLLLLPPVHQKHFTSQEKIHSFNLCVNYFTL